jgi:hypothetical protein
MGGLVRVLYAVICEHAEVRDDLRIDVHGIFQQLYAPGFPAQQDVLVLVVNLEWSDEEAGRNEFRIDLLDPGASPALTITGHTEVIERDPSDAPPQTRIVMPLEDLVFPVAGTYEFELQARGQRIRLAPLHLIEDPESGE